MEYQATKGNAEVFNRLKIQASSSREVDVVEVGQVGNGGLRCQPPCSGSLVERLFLHRCVAMHLKPATVHVLFELLREARSD